MGTKLDEETLQKIERTYAQGISSQQILEIFRNAGEKLSEATLRKYVQVGLLPRSKRVGRKGKHQGSQGLYPPRVVRQICRVRELMAQNYTIEQIVNEFLFVRGDIEELERTLSRIFIELEKVSERTKGEATERVIVAEIQSARQLASELVAKLTAVETRLIKRVELARAAGLFRYVGDLFPHKERIHARDPAVGTGVLWAAVGPQVLLWESEMNPTNSKDQASKNNAQTTAKPLATAGQTGLARAAQNDTSPQATAVTREQRRSRRKRAVRARTISVKRMTKRELELGRLLYPETDHNKPKTRAECANGMRPCPYVSCHHHLFLDVSARTGAIKLNFPDLEVEEMNESCALDVADRGGTTLEEVGAIMNLTRERIRQLEVKALAKLSALDDMESLRDFVDEGPVGKRRLPVLDAAPKKGKKAKAVEEPVVSAEPVDEFEVADNAEATAPKSPVLLDLEANDFA